MFDILNHKGAQLLNSYFMSLSIMKLFRLSDMMSVNKKYSIHTVACQGENIQKYKVHYFSQITQLQIKCQCGGKVLFRRRFWQTLYSFCLDFTAHKLVEMMLLLGRICGGSVAAAADGKQAGLMETRAESKCPDFTALADSRTLRARFWEVCEYWGSKPTIHQVHKKPKADFLQTSIESAQGTDFTRLHTENYP